MTATVLLSISLAFTSTLAVVVCYGFYKLMKSTVETEEASMALYSELQTYRNHLEEVYSRDTFYGDEVLGNLLDHTRDIEEYIKEFVDVASIEENDQFQDEAYDESDNTTQTS